MKDYKHTFPSRGQHKFCLSCRGQTVKPFDEENLHITEIVSVATEEINRKTLKQMQHFKLSFNDC